jgi:hypothetical protein
MFPRVRLADTIGVNLNVSVSSTAVTFSVKLPANAISPSTCAPRDQRYYMRMNDYNRAERKMTRKE